MAIDPTLPPTSGRLSGLILRWEELLDGGRDVAAAEICADCPELAEVLGREVAKLRALRPALGDGPEAVRTETDAGAPEAASTPRAEPDWGAGRYRLIRRIGGGGMGDVYLVRDGLLGRDVALKEIKPGRDTSPEAVARFLREAKVCASLEHPGIVPVYDFGWVEGRSPFYVMRHIRGTDFEAEIKTFHRDRAQEPGTLARSIPFRRLLGRLRAICEALAYAHSRGLIHRDIKPKNIMIGDYGETLVVDWGLVKAVRGEGPDPTKDLPGLDSEFSADGSIVGTPAYMSPGQATGRPVEPSSDVYSVGATLYTILAGERAFRGRSAEILRDVSLGAFPPPRAHNPEVPGALEAICLKAMSLHPRDRYPTPLALADDIERWLGDEPLSIHRDPLPRRIRRWSRRHPRAVTASVVLVIGSILGLAADDVRVGWERTRADSGFKTAREAVAKILTEVASSELPAVPRSEAIRRRVVEAALAYNERFLAQQPSDPGVRADAAVVHREAANILRMLGDFDASYAAYLKAIGLLEDLSREQPENLDCRASLALTLVDVGELHLMEGLTGSAERFYLGASKLAEPLLVARSPHPSNGRPMGMALLGLAEALIESGRAVEAREPAARAVELLEPPVLEGTTDPMGVILLAMALECRGKSMRGAGTSEESERLLLGSIALIDRLHVWLRDRPPAAGPSADLLMPNLAYTRSSSRVELGLTIAGIPGRRDEASRQLDAAIDGLSRLADGFPGIAGYRLSLANAHRARGEIRSAGGAHEAALKDHQDARDLLDNLAKAHPRNARYHGMLGRVMAEIGRIASARGDHEAARAARARAASELGMALGIDPRRAQDRDAARDQDHRGGRVK